MAIKDFLDNVTYPNMERRTDILLNYFNTSDLHLSIDSYLQLNNLSKDIKADFFDSNGLFYTVNKDLREKIRRFNNDVFYITDSLFRMVNYYKLMCDSENETNKIIYETLFRKSARCVCTEIFMYEEKIKNLIRIILNLDKSTREYKIFMSRISNISKTNKYVNAFRKAYISYSKNANVKFIKQIRHDEIHNDSPIDEYTDIQTLAPGVISQCELYFVINNDELYNKIKEVLLQQSILKNHLQTILDNHKI